MSVRRLIILLAGSFLAAQVQAASSLSASNVTAAAGSTADIVISLTTGASDNLSTAIFDVVLPPGVSTNTVIAGTMMTTAGKGIQSGVNNGNHWTIIVSNGSGVMTTAPLLTVRVNIAAGTPAGDLTINLVGNDFSDALGNTVASGANTPGTLTVTTTGGGGGGGGGGGTANTPVITSAGTASATVGIPFSFQITASSSPTSFNATGRPAWLNLDAVNGLLTGTPNAAGTSNIIVSAANAGGFGSTTTLILTSLAPVAPTLSVGSVSSPAGSTVDLPITFNAGSGLVSTLDFDLILPPTVSTVTIVDGAVMTAAGKSHQDGINGGNHWSIVVSNGANTMGSGLLLTARVQLSASATGTIPIAITNVEFSDAGANTVASGTNTSGSITVTTAGTVATPTFNPPAGNFTGSVAVSIQTTTSAAAIHYTLDGSNPTITSPIFTVPITLTNTTTLKAIATKTGLAQSAVATAVYTLTAAGPVQPPTLTMPAFIPVTGAITAGFGNNSTNISFIWTITRVGDSAPSPMAAGAPGIIGRATSVSNFPTQSNVMGLAGQSLVPGYYQVSVQATNGTNTSAAVFGNTTFVPADLNAIRVYPNPWRVDKHAAHPFVTFDSLTVNTTIKIFTVSGHHVKTLPQSSSTVNWDLTNNSGDKVASGLYVYLITTDDGQKKTGQVVIIH